MRELVIIGEEEIGKTTLANALLGWDFFPQSTWDLYMPTEEADSRMLTDSIRLTDTPGYDLWGFRVPEAVNEAVGRADTVIMMLKGLGTEEDADLDDADLETVEAVCQWLKDLAKEEKLQKDLLAKVKDRDIYFVIPFETEDAQINYEELFHDLRLVREKYAPLSAHGQAGVFCVDPMMALIASIEADDQALARSGILPLKAALLEEKGVITDGYGNVP